MPRRGRCVLPDVPRHITQRGVDRCETFSTDDDRHTYLRLLRDNLGDAEVKLLGWCVMSNHVHLIAVPSREDSLAVLFRRVHGRYAQYYNVRRGRTGHLWQNRFFACCLDAQHLWVALAYVERNPVRAGMVASAREYRWSSAIAHVTGTDEDGLIDMEWWKANGAVAEWADVLRCEDAVASSELRASTYAGRPFGDELFLTDIGARFGRGWSRRRPRKGGAEKGEPPVVEDKKAQFSLF
jgi:putative transposase